MSLARWDVSAGDGADEDAYRILSTPGHAISGVDDQVVLAFLAAHASRHRGRVGDGISCYLMGGSGTTDVGGLGL